MSESEGGELHDEIEQFIKNGEPSEIRKDTWPFEHAPSKAQEQLALEFYSSICAEIKDANDYKTYPTPLDLLEKYNAYISENEKKYQQEIFPKFSISNVGAISAAEARSEEEMSSDERRKHNEIKVLLKWAMNLEPMNYPLMDIQRAREKQGDLKKKAQNNLSKFYPEMNWSGFEISLSTAYGPYRFFEDEPEEETTRHSAMTTSRVLIGNLRNAREGTKSGYLQIPFGVKEIIQSATRYGHDDIDKYDLEDVFAVSKRLLVAQDLSEGWSDQARDVFAVNHLLEEAVDYAKDHHSK